jgi:hypothetical protein
MPEVPLPDTPPPDTPPPDDKDWTWVLERPCPECGFDPVEHPRGVLADETRTVGAAWVARLGRSDVRTRPRPDRWSVLEYGCHVRDVLRIADGRIALLVAEDAPTFADWDQDATAAADRYDRQDPDAVAGELARAAGDFADRLEAVTGAAWDRPGLRSNGSRFTVESLSRYILHDPVHHLWDVGGV